MNKREYVDLITTHVRKYRAEIAQQLLLDNHMHDYRGTPPNQELVDAILTVFTNMAARPMDLALYTTDLSGPVVQKPKREDHDELVGRIMAELAGRPWDDPVYDKLGDSLTMRLLFVLIFDSNPAPFLAASMCEPDLRGMEPPFTEVPDELLLEIHQKLFGGPPEEHGNPST